MRGTRIANSASDHRATTWGQPHPNGTVIRPYHHMAMTVGSAGNLRGFRPTDHTISQYGLLQPDKWANERIFDFSVNTTNDLLTITFTSQAGVLLPNVATLLVTITGFKNNQLAPFEAVAGTNSYTATVAGLGAYMDANVDKVLAIRLGRRA